MPRRPPAGSAPSTAVELPPECLQLLLRHCLRTLHIVMPAPGQEEEFPDYAHGLAEWKEACSACKSAVKYILAEAAAILTAAALGEIAGLVASVGTMVSEAAACTGDPGPISAATHALDVRPRLYPLPHLHRFIGQLSSATKLRVPPAAIHPAHADAVSPCQFPLPLVPRHLERGTLRTGTAPVDVQVLAFVLDAIVPPICSYGTLAEARPGLSALAGQIMAFRPSHMTHVAGVARALETLGPLLVILPEHTPRVIEAFFGLIDRMHQLRGGPVDSSDSGPYLKEQRATSKCYYTLAAKAPRAFVPHLEAIAQRTTGLVATGALGYADQNTISEGLLASAASDGAGLYGRVVAALVAPVRPSWEALLEHLVGPVEMATRMLGPTQLGADGTVHVGGTEQRAFVYYSMQLLLFCARQAKSVAQQKGYEVPHPRSRTADAGAVAAYQRCVCS